ncbi:unnamed protein product [Brassica rapa subsp. trilocularis]
MSYMYFFVVRLVLEVRELKPLVSILYIRQSQPLYLLVETGFSSSSWHLSSILALDSDPISGNWWLAIGVDTFEPVGYWPAELFTTMSDHATMVEWGGEILYRNTSGLSTITQMGSGEFPEKGYRKSAYFCNLNVAEEHNSLQPVEDFNLQADHEELYTIMKSNTEACGNHFYFGGPGHGPVRSTAVRAAATFVFLFSAVLLVL